MTSIYPNSETGADLTIDEKKGVVGACIIVMFLLMAFEVVDAERMQHGMLFLPSHWSVERKRGTEVLRAESEA